MKKYPFQKFQQDEIPALMEKIQELNRKNLNFNLNLPENQVLNRQSALFSLKEEIENLNREYFNVLFQLQDLRDKIKNSLHREKNPALKEKLAKTADFFENCFSQHEKNLLHILEIIQKSLTEIQSMIS